MLLPLEKLMLSIPFSNSEDHALSSKYYWDNSQRGDVDHFVILQWTHSGEGVFEIDGTPHPVPPGHALLAIVPERSAYYYPRGAAAPWRFAWANFYGDLSVSLFSDFRRTFGPVAPLPFGSAAANHLLKLIEQARTRRNHDPHDTSAACYSFVMEWMRQLEQPREEHGGDAVEAAIRTCEISFREPIGVKELSAGAGVSREHFTRLFTARTGVSPAQYLRAVRAGKAAQMLENGAVTLKEAAMRCGFPSVRALRSALGSH
jgi:AraC-like DNA-binding protein